MVGFFTRYHLPRLKTWLLVEIERQSNENSPVRVWAKNADLSLFPLGIVISDIQVIPKDELKKQMAPIQIKSLGVSLNWLALFAGEVRVSTLLVQQPEVIVILQENPFKRSEGELKEEPKFEIDWPRIFAIPIDQISIQNLSLMAKLRNEALAFQLKDFSFSVENRFDSLLVNLKAPFVLLKQIGPHPRLELSFETRFLMDPEEVQLAALKVARKNSYLVASGRLSGDFSEMKVQKSTMDLRGSLDASELPAWAYTFASMAELPTLKGQIDFDTRIAAEDINQLPKVEFSIETRDLMIDKFEVDQLIAHGDLLDQTLIFKDFRLQNRSGKARIKDLNLGLKDKYNISGQLESSGLELGLFLGTLGVEAPLHLAFKGQAPCSGQLGQPLSVKCKVSMQGENLHIYSGEEKKTIVKASKMSAQGETEINSKGIFYTADILGGEKSKGGSKGEILYASGFKIQYHADLLAFSDIEDLAGLRLEGQANLKGSTEGNSKTATFKMDVSGQDIWMADFLLGQTQSEVRYSAGTLNFRKIKGAVGTSRYEGQLAIDLLKSELYLNAKIPFADLDDIKTLLTRRLPLPFRISGTGSGDLKAWGPLDFDKMNYEVNTGFYRGTVESESFDELIVKINGAQGTATAKQVYASKGASKVELIGSLSHAGAVQSSVAGRALRLEQSETLGKLGLDMTGRFDFNMDIKGQLPQPRIDLSGQLSKLLIGDTPSEDSNFRVTLDSQSITGSGSFIGTTVKTDFIWPRVEGQPFKFNFSSQNWDFTQLFQIVSQSARQKDFETSLTADIQLESPNGKIWSSNGIARIDEFLIRRGTLELSSKKPMKLVFDRGKVSAEDFLLDGQNSFLKLESHHSTEEKLNASLNGKMDLALLSLLTPFLEDLRGPMSFSISFQGPLLSPQIIGSAYIEDGNLKLKEFPHPFEKIKADILFNQKNILINALKSNLAGGELSGDGRIRLESLNEVPINIRAQFRDVRLNFPQGIESQGFGQLTLTGDFFPYLLSLNYNVTQSLVSMEFTGNNQGSNEIKPSTFLPKFLTEERFQPLELNLDLEMLKPVQIKNSRAEAQVKGNLSVKGTPDAPRLTGTLTPLPGGTLKFRENQFEILTGFVEFNQDPPDNPTIYLSSQARVTEVVYLQNGGIQREVQNDYDIRLLAQGKAKNPRLTLESQPPLSDREIVSLLALGMTSTTVGEGYRQGDQQSAAAPGVIGTQLGAQLFESQLGKQFKDRLGVDVKIGTSFNTDENASFPKVTFSKQWTPKFEASASRTIEPNPTSDVKLEYKFNRNASVIGFWEGKQEDASQQSLNRQSDESKVGLDLEYRIEFK